MMNSKFQFRKSFTSWDTTYRPLKPTGKWRIITHQQDPEWFIQKTVLFIQHKNWFSTEWVSENRISLVCDNEC
jgi:hypothetical protein